MDYREEILKERRKNEQVKSLQELDKLFRWYFDEKIFSMHIEITLDDYKPEYHLVYDRDNLPLTLNEYSKMLSTHINAYFCKLFEELERFNEGWYYHCDKSNGGSIFIKNDGILLYHWHYKYSDSQENWSFQSTLMSIYFSMLVCLLPLFYREIGYEGKLHLKLEINNIEKCVFFPPSSSSSRKLYPYTQISFKPIKRIIFLNKLSQTEEKIRVVHETFNEILSRYFKYYNYQIPHGCINLFNRLPTNNS